MKNNGSPMEVIEDLYNTHYRYMLNFLLRLTPDRQLAEDIVQEVFSNLLTHPETMLKVRNIQSFLITSARNRLIDHYRKKKRSLLQDGQMMERLLIDQYSASRIPERKEIQEILLKLPREYSFVLIARDYYGYSYQEIADLLGISLENAKTRIFRARKSFLKHFREADKDDRF
ncbi:RNA polymerase sigma factor [Caldibacillus debilis]|uniref:RNA polymerase sigma factor n=1 Tax=Caldibacillus debilis TaxID=301148 RepID=UPI0009D9EAC3|nr:RNA polymerase sigma factor [Caldibacillus debilis]